MSNHLFTGYPEHSPMYVPLALLGAAPSPGPPHHILQCVQVAGDWNIN